MSSPSGSLAETGRAFAAAFVEGFNTPPASFAEWQPSPLFWDTIRRSAATLEVPVYSANRARFIHAHKPKMRVRSERQI